MESMTYNIEDIPKWYLCILFGFQQYLTMLSGIISYPQLLAPGLCINENNPDRGHIISTSFFVSGVATILQATFGCRLPIIQGSSYSFLLPTLAILNLPQWQCPNVTCSGDFRETIKTIKHGNETTASDPTECEGYEDIWKLRMREIQGAIICASVVEIFLGATGLVGYLLKIITPVTIAPLIALIGLGLFQTAGDIAETYWPISISTMVLLVVFSQYLDEVKIPCISYSTEKGLYKVKLPIFKMFPVILAIFISWLFCFILTSAGALPEKNNARTDLRISVISDSPWIRFPYPGQWGYPTFSVGAAIGMFCGVLCSVIESIGDYYACAKLSGAPPPPRHAINRGITVEGLGCLFAGLCGSGSALTSFSQNIGAIGITKVGSRRVIQWAGVIMIILSIISKFGSLFIIMPVPILGGIFPFMFSMISGVGLSSLQYLNLNSSRNVFIVGTSLFLGLMVPSWVKTHPGVIKTGSSFADELLTVLLSTGIFITASVSIFLDNTIKGTTEERGILKWSDHTEYVSDGELVSEEEKSKKEQQKCCYMLPIGNKFFEKHDFLKNVPISPTYNKK